MLASNISPQLQTPWMFFFPTGIITKTDSIRIDLSDFSIQPRGTAKCPKTWSTFRHI